MIAVCLLSVEHTVGGFCTCNSKKSVCSLQEAQDCIEKLKDLSLAKGNSDMSSAIMNFSDCFIHELVTFSSKQTKISDLFKKC